MTWEYNTLSNLSSSSLISTQGPIFDIQTKSKNVTIGGFDLNCNVPEGIASKVFVYSLPGGNYYEDGKWYKKNLWDKVLESPITCQGFGTPTQVKRLCLSIHLSVRTPLSFKSHSHSKWSSSLLSTQVALPEAVTVPKESVSSTLCDILWFPSVRSLQF